MRFIHYMAWCAHQVAEDGHSRVAPDFGTREYWLRELGDLDQQLERIRSAAQRVVGIHVPDRGRRRDRQGERDGDQDRGEETLRP
jgi:hypothetical protein